MEAQFFTLKEVELNNNCPECYSKNGLQLTFKQRFIENHFYKAISKETTHSLFCNVCQTMIFPARWTDDIDRVFDYQQRAASPKNTSVKLKPITWMVIIAAALFLIITTLYYTGIF